MKTKWCWLAKQYRKGWRLGLCLGHASPLYVPVWFHSKADVQRILPVGKTIFVEMVKERKTR